MNETQDLLLIAAYVILTVVVGLLLRGRQSAANDYFLGRDRIPWWLALFSIVATETSTVTFLSIPGVAYNGNLTFLQLPLGYIVGRLLIAAFLIPRFLDGEHMTLYEMLGQRFGRVIQRLTSGIFIITRSIADGLRLYLTALVFRELLAWDMKWVVAVVGALTIVYTFAGGLRAVVWTDLMQFVAYMAGAGIVAWIVLPQINGGLGAVMSQAAEAGKLQVFDWRFDLAVPFTFWSGLIGGAFISAASHGADQMMVQRYLATRSVQQARWALGLSGFVVLVQFAIFLVLGLVLFTFFQGQEFASGDEVFARFIAQELPFGLRGLIVAAALSAAMSTLSSSLNSISAAAIADFYRPLVGACDEARELRWARSLTVVAGLVQIAVALGSDQWGAARSTVMAVITIAAMTTGLTLGVLILGAAVRRADEKTAVMAMAVGAVVVVSVWWQGTVSGLWFALVGSATTFIVGALLAPKAR